MDSDIIVLPRYFKVTKGEDQPLFKFLRKIECKQTHGIEDMWIEHNHAMEKFRVEKMRDFKGMKGERDPDYSLLDLKHDISLELLKSCVFCERRCKANRAAGKLGWCRVSDTSHVTAMFVHIGEERALVPSGTIFFSGCTMRCVYCQNWDISQFPNRGNPVTGVDLAKWIDGKAESGKIINANFVGGEPTPNLHTILDTLRHCLTNTPMVWNSNMYMSEETIALLEGAIDIYLADFRYGNDKCAMRLSSVPNYWETITRNFLLTSNTTEMIIRILVLPDHVEDDALPILKWIGENIAHKVYVNLMRQYRPEYKAGDYEDISRSLRHDEYQKALSYLKQHGIKYYETQ
jgi:putative pyruvate formate lyase activating enzyme